MFSIYSYVNVRFIEGNKNTDVDKRNVKRKLLGRQKFTRNAFYWRWYDTRDSKSWIKFSVTLKIPPLDFCFTANYGVITRKAGRGYSWFVSPVLFFLLVFGLFASSLFLNNFSASLLSPFYRCIFAFFLQKYSHRKCWQQRGVSLYPEGKLTIATGVF